MFVIAVTGPQNRSPETSRTVIPVGGKIRSLAFVFPCNMATTDDPNGVKLFGTGGNNFRPDALQNGGGRQAASHIVMRLCVFVLVLYISSTNEQNA